MRSALAIGFEYRPSRWVPRVVALVTGLAVVATLLCGASTTVRMALSALAVASCAWTVRRLHPPICAVGLGAQSGWTVRGLDGTDDAAVLVSARVMRQVIVLRLASHRHGRFTLWLTPDNADADVRRRLRMRLAVLEAEPRENAA